MGVAVFWRGGFACLVGWLVGCSFVCTLIFLLFLSFSLLQLL